MSGGSPGASQVMAAARSSHFSRQVWHWSPLLRRHASAVTLAVAIFCSEAWFCSERAPDGQAFTQGKSLQNRQKASPARKAGVPSSKSLALKTGLIAKNWQALTQAPQRWHFSRNSCSGRAPGGRINSGNLSANSASSSGKAA